MSLEVVFSSRVKVALNPIPKLSGKPALMTVYRNEGRWDTSNTVFEAGRVARYDKRDRTAAMHRSAKIM